MNEARCLVVRGALFALVAFPFALTDLLRSSYADALRTALFGVRCSAASARSK